MTSKTYIPWVEKYRPENFEDIVLDKYNKILFTNIIKTNNFPNILIYGPPGTGKTTTIINLINLYQTQNNQINKGLIIHLNASDERGIDIIRNQINSFVSSKSLFTSGIKFIILDEVDYMTKTAQVALKYLLQEYNINIRFCLICNYISKIDESLQNEFMKIQFNRLPKDDIIRFLNIINITEKLNLSIEQIEFIQINYNSDIRSMINYMQSNQLAIVNTKVIDNKIYCKITQCVTNKDLKNFISVFYNISFEHNIDIKNIIKNYFNYLIKINPKIITVDLLNMMEIILHNSDSNFECHLKLIYYSLLDISV